MVTIAGLTDLEDYSLDQVAEIKKYSAATSHYFSLIEKSAKDSSSEIRILRHRAWLKAALATYFERHSTREIVEYWSEQADQLIQRAWVEAKMDSHRVALFAFGKLGAHELNLSSDIDLLFVSHHPADTELLTSLRKFIQLLAESTEWGFAFRVDTDLRPGGRLGPLVSSVLQFEDYYATQGATWERLAFVRLRPITGDKEVINSVTDISRHFSYRKFLDYTLFENLKNLRNLIQAHKQVDHVLNLKLDRGGIRDIELFIHALQVIHGGKNKKIQIRSTEDAGQCLIDEKLFSKAAMNCLIENYWYFRHLEHQVQLKEDNQTHVWDKAEQRNDIRDRQSQVTNIVNELLGTNEEPLPRPPATSEEQTQWLKALGYNQHSQLKTWPALRQLTALSSNKQRDEQARQEFLFLCTTELAASSIDMNLGLSLITEFVRSTRAKASFFSLLNKENQLRQSLVQLFGTSPYLGQILASRPELIDSFIYRTQDTVKNDTDDVLDSLTERRLLTDILASSQFLKHKSIITFSSELSFCADTICNDLLAHIKQLYGSKNLSLVKLGKWGGKELGLKSDLDFFFFTEESPTAADHKAARRFISWVTEQHRGGSMYQIDLRLRPSGNAGPVIVSRTQLESFLNKDIPVWQRQSYLKFRTDQLVANELLSSFNNKTITQSDLEELTRIRIELTKSGSVFNLKKTRGGLIDIEFAVQTQFLIRKIHPQSPTTNNMILELEKYDNAWADSGPALRQIYLELRKYEQLYQLMSGHSGSELNPLSEAFSRLAIHLNQDPDELHKSLKQLTSQAQLILKDLDPVFSAI